MDAFVKIGECFWIGTCLLGIFLSLSMLTSLKFGILIKFAIPIFGFLIGMSMGAYLGNLLSPNVARAAAIPSGLVGLLISSWISSQAQES